MERVADDVAFGLENRAWSPERMLARVPEALAELGLAGFDRRRSAELSGGEQQRLALAGVTAPGPRVVVLDEPTSNLDPAGTAAVLERVATLRANGTTIVLVEHRVELAWPLADRVLALGRDGSPIDFGRPAEVLARSRAALDAEGIWLPLGRTHRAGGGGRAAAASSPGRLDADGRGGEAAAGSTLPPEVLDVRDVRYSYLPGRPAVRDVDLRVAAGEPVALSGPNGSGKSTLLRLVAGVLRPSAGSIRLAGQDPARVPARRLARLAGFVFQDPELGFLADTVADEVMAGLEPDETAAAAGLMDRLGLPLGEFGSRSPYRLSGGEQRRLSIAAALARRPRLLLLDEPTYGQDRRGWEGLVAILEELVRGGVAVVAATHDERFAERFGRRLVRMADGWIISDEPNPPAAPDVSAAASA
jgi:energy-coupling factor transport system ATP-binding protein